MSKNCVLAILSLLLLIGIASAYSGGGGTCSCGDGTTMLGGNDTDACEDCYEALNDDQNCTVQVNYVGTVAISDYSGTCINSMSNFNNKTFDCHGNTLDGDSGGTDYGIYTDTTTNITIQNCVITEFETAFYIVSTTDSQFLNNTGNSNTYRGFWFYTSPDNDISDSTATDNDDHGFMLEASSRCALTDNNISSNNDYGLHLDLSSNCTLTNTIANSNTWTGLYLTGGSSNNTITGSTVNGNGNNGLSLRNACDYNRLTNNTANNNGNNGISFRTSSSNNTAYNNTANDNYIGFWIYDYSDDNVLGNNTANSNDYGIYVQDYSDNTTIANNTANYNDYDGLYFSDVDSTGNNASYNTFCFNNQSGGGYYDISDVDSNTGDDNTCDTTYSWNDTGTVGCTSPCPDLTPPTIDWNWTDINSTTSSNSTTICVNASETVNCTLDFNGTDYVNSTMGTNICWNIANRANGNYSSITATCEDAAANPATTTTAWWNVSRIYTMQLSWIAWAGRNTTSLFNTTTIGLTSTDAAYCTLRRYSDDQQWANSTLTTSPTWNQTNLPNSNHTYYAWCTAPQYNPANTTLAWWNVSYQDVTPPTLDWNWSDINSTISVDYTTVCVNASETVNCTLDFNGTDYVNSTVATNVCWTMTGLSDGNHSSVSATCDDAASNPASTTTAWVMVGTGLNVLVTKSANESTVYPGEAINWTITVNNTGIYTVNVTLNDSNGQNFTMMNLAPGSSNTTSYTTNTSCSSITNTVNATIDGPFTETSQDSALVTVNSCGDALCNCGETCSSCAADCGTCSEDDDDDGGGGGGGNYVFFKPGAPDFKPPDDGPDKIPYIVQKTEEPVAEDDLEVTVWYTDGTPGEGEVTVIAPDGTTFRSKIEDSVVSIMPHIEGEWVFKYIDSDGKVATRKVRVGEAFVENQTVINETIIQIADKDEPYDFFMLWVGVLLLILAVVGLFIFFWKRRKKKKEIEEL